jgi:uncharacterized protein (DUF1697 family)
MNRYISLLRGINVSGQKTIRMTDLLTLYQSLGFEKVVTYLQSGNVVFHSPVKDCPALAARIEQSIEREFGFTVPVLVHEAGRFREILENNPFINQRNADITVLHTTFLFQSPADSSLKKLEGPKGETDEFVVWKDVVYLFCPNGYGRTKLSNTFFERKLGIPATTRNWKTVRALYELGAQ